MAKKRILEKYNGSKLEWLHDSMHFIILTVLVFVLFRFVIGISIIGGDSMKPSFHSGDIVVYLRIVPEYMPGDVVSMRVPAGDYYVKRVIAVGGDTVDIRDGSVLVNGADIADENASGVTEEQTSAVIFPYTVREGNVFVLGDNRQVSMDSRTFGEVNRRQIKGKIIMHFETGTGS